MPKIIGIDLGTSNSAAAVLEAGRPRIIPSAEGATLYPGASPAIRSAVPAGGGVRWSGLSLLAPYPG